MPDTPPATVPLRFSHLWDQARGPALSRALEPARPTWIEIFLDHARDRPDADAIDYHGTRLTYAELLDLATGLAAHLRAEGLQPGDRVALYLQSSPSFVVTVIGTWLAGGVCVPVNPMYRSHEMTVVLRDSGARALVTSYVGLDDVAEDVLPATDVTIVVLANELDLQERDDPRVFGQLERTDPDERDLLRVIRAAGSATGAFERFPVPPESPAFLCYTSGTTGPPKGAVLTHDIVVRNCENIRVWQGLGPEDRFYALAPLFHVTGLVGELGAALASGGLLVLPYRFVPAVALETFLETRPTFMVGPATAYTALRNAPGARREHFTSFTTVLHGGAPLPRAVVEEFEERFGIYLENGYGLTETAGPAVSIPDGARGAVDPESGAVSIGMPYPGIDLRIVDEEGAALGSGERGEIALRGPTVIAEYWGDHGTDAEAVVEGWFRTGDVGFVDDDGWVFVVDRTKDMIIASGFKVWPGEVEQVLYAHPAVGDAAVVGVADDYRGETVKAFVSLRNGAVATPDELVSWCRSRLAAYKCPRIVEVVEDLPRNPSGKILRRMLRDTP